ncbi:MAG: trigger factor [bacterium]|nr:trigger factor [bacterium]
MKWMKHVTVLALSAILGLTAIGCGAKEQQPATNEEKPTTKIRDYDVSKFVSLGDYKNMNVTVEGDFEVTDEEVTEYVNNMLAYYPSYEDSDKQVVEDGDYVDIDYEGKRDGVAFEGGTAKGYTLGIGTNSFIEGFESGLIGAKVGETRDLNLTFPEDYHSEDLAGADVVFTVTVNKIKNKIDMTCDSLTDEYVKNNFYLDSVDAFMAETRAYMEEESAANENVAKRQAVLNQLLESSTVKIPDGLLEMKVDQYIQQFTNKNSADGKTLESYLQENYQMSEAQFREQITEEMKSNLEMELVLEALAKAENETIDETAFSNYISSTISQSGLKDETSLYEMYTTDYEDGKTYLENNFLLTQALSNVVENSTFDYTGKNANE